MEAFALRQPRRLAARASLVSIDQAGHDLEVDQPERVLAAVREFLGQPR